METDILAEGLRKDMVAAMRDAMDTTSMANIAAARQAIKRGPNGPSFHGITVRGLVSSDTPIKQCAS